MWITIYRYKVRAERFRRKDISVIEHTISRLYRKSEMRLSVPTEPTGVEPVVAGGSLVLDSLAEICEYVYRLLFSDSIKPVLTTFEIHCALAVGVFKFLRCELRTVK